MTFVVCIDGIIGAGKSTLLKRLSTRYACFPEPLSQWNLLNRFYEEPAVYGLAFHLQILVSQFEQSRRFRDLSLAVVERCPQTSRHVFCPLVLTDVDDVLAYETAYRRLAYRVDRVVYLDVEPEVALERIRGRREREEGGGDEKPIRISLDYLRRLRERYEAVVEDGSLPVAARIRVDDKSPEEVEREAVRTIASLFRDSQKM